MLTLLISFFMPIPQLNYEQNFFDFLQFQKRYSKNTIVSYKNDLASFFNFLQERYPDTNLSDIKPVYIRSWLAEMKDHKLTARS